MTFFAAPWLLAASKNGAKYLAPTESIGPGARICSLFLVTIEVGLGGHKIWEVFRGVVGEPFFANSP
jgi:hypothetical protein